MDAVDGFTHARMHPFLFKDPVSLCTCSRRRNRKCTTNSIQLLLSSSKQRGVCTRRAVCDRTMPPGACTDSLIHYSVRILLFGKARESSDFAHLAEKMMAQSRDQSLLRRRSIGHSSGTVTINLSFQRINPVCFHHRRCSVYIGQFTTQPEDAC